jgi:hypothetical protein
VLPRYAKVLGWICVGIMNVFFVYFSILRAYERGYVWQQMFAFACLVQFLVEVIFYETTECAMVHFLIPDLVRTEVQTAGVALRNIVNQVCTSQSLGLSTTSSSSSNVLDAPRYLFVSTNVAEKYPDMLESVLIRSYHSCWPGCYSSKWKFDHFSGASLLLSSGRGGGGGLSGGFLRGFSVTVILISLLKEFGASAPVIQRLLLHSIQPLCVAAIFFVGSIFLLRPLYWLTLVPVLVYAVYSYRHYRWQVSQDEAGDGEGEGDIHPIEDKKTQINVDVKSPSPAVADSVLVPDSFDCHGEDSEEYASDGFGSSNSLSDHSDSDDCISSLHPPLPQPFSDTDHDHLNIQFGSFEDASSDSSEWVISAEDEDQSPSQSRHRLSSDSFFGGNRPFAYSFDDTSDSNIDRHSHRDHGQEPDNSS